MAARTATRPRVLEQELGVGDANQEQPEGGRKERETVKGKGGTMAGGGRTHQPERERANSEEAMMLL